MDDPVKLPPGTVHGCYDSTKQRGILERVGDPTIFRLQGRNCNWVYGIEDAIYVANRMLPEGVKLLCTASPRLDGDDGWTPENTFTVFIWRQDIHGDSVENQIASWPSEE